jgi:GntR family transcriptional regulator
MQSDSLPIRRQSPVPIYLQIANLLLEKINAGLLQPDDKLPSEIELISQYRASRITIRLAIKHLVTQGVVASRQGKGTYVLAPTIKLELGQFKGLYEQIKMQGINPDTELITVIINPSTLPAAALELAGTGKHIVEFVRLYRTDTQAFAEVHGWYATNVTPERAMLERYPVLGVIIREFGSAIASAELGIRAVKATAKLARSLDIGRSDPVLLLRRASFLSNKKMCEYAEIHIRAERYEFRLHTEGPLSVTSAIHPLDRSVRKRAEESSGSSGSKRKSSQSTP